MTLVFETVEKAYHIEREPLEAAMQEYLHEAVSQLGTLNPMLKSVLKGGIDMLAMNIGLDIPRGVDKIEYLAAYAIKAALDRVEGQAIPVQVKEVTKDAEPLSQA